MEGLTKAYTYESLLILFSVIIFPDEVVSWGTKLQTANHISGWIPMRSQDNSFSYHVWNHNLNDLPIKVDVQVKPQTGSDTGYFFPGIAAAQRDDSMALSYGGIVYKYNKNSVMLYAPNKNSGKPLGHAIYTGGSVWNGPKQQTESNVLTRVRVWGEQHFPTPDFKQDWKPIRIAEASPREIPHGLGVQPEYVALQIKLGSTEDVADGIGYMMVIESSFKGDKWGGVPYAYDDTNIRVWTRYLGGTLFTIPEGWGTSQEMYKSGQYRILAWISLKAKTKIIYSHLNLPSSSNTEVNFSKAINQNRDIMQVMVKELPNSSGSNRNAGYSFRATGAVQNTLTNSSYGGVVYSYSNQSIRVWYPPVKNHAKLYLVYLDNFFGKSSTSAKAELEITTFVPYDSPGLSTVTTTPMTSSTPKTSSTPTTTISTTPLTKTSTTKKTTTAKPMTSTPKATTSISTTTTPIRTTTTSTLPTSTTPTATSVSSKTTTTSALTTTTKSKPTSTIVMSTTTLTNGVSNKMISSNTGKLCKLKFDYWVYLLIGFGSCLVLVSIIWLCWYCLRSKDSKVTNIMEDKKRKTSLSVTKKEAWSLDCI